MFAPRKLLVVAPLLVSLAAHAHPPSGDAQEANARNAELAALRPIAPLLDPDTGRPMPGNVRGHTSPEVQPLVDPVDGRPLPGNCVMTKGGCR